MNPVELSHTFTLCVSLSPLLSLPPSLLSSLSRQAVTLESSVRDTIKQMPNVDEWQIDAMLGSPMPLNMSEENHIHKKRPLKETGQDPEAPTTSTQANSSLSSRDQNVFKVRY